MTEQDKRLVFRCLLMLLRFSATLLNRYVSDIQPVLRDDYHNLKNDLVERIG
jgi:hypothetical protein